MLVSMADVTMHITDGRNLSKESLYRYSFSPLHLWAYIHSS